MLYINLCIYRSTAKLPFAVPSFHKVHSGKKKIPHLWLIYITVFKISKHAKIENAKIPTFILWQFVYSFLLRILKLKLFGKILSLVWLSNRKKANFALSFLPSRITILLYKWAKGCKFFCLSSVCKISSEVWKLVWRKPFYHNSPRSKANSQWCE